MRVYADHNRVDNNYSRHWCVQIPYRGYDISIAGKELLIFDADNDPLNEWDGKPFRLICNEGADIKRAMDFIDYTLRDEE